MKNSHPMLVRDEANLVAVVIQAAKVAKSAGLSKVAGQQLTTVTSELARNILKYAGQGRVRLDVIKVDGRKGVRVIASDRGPGIENVELALTEHYSTQGTLGLGLSGAKRMMDEFTVVSAPGEGTLVEAIKWG